MLLGGTMHTEISMLIISLLSKIFSNGYIHSELNNIFIYARASKDIPDGAKQAKITK